MRKTLIRSTLLALIVSLFTIVPVLAYTYSAYITVTESGGNNYTQSPFNVFMDNDYLATQGYITDDGLDVNVSVNGALVPRMVVSDRTLFVSDLAANHTITPLLTTGNTPATSMEIIVGNDGYIETVDDASMEIGSDDFLYATTGYFDTSLGANKYILYKNGAINIQNDAASQITADFSGASTSIAGVASGIHDIAVGTIMAPELVGGNYINVTPNSAVDYGLGSYTISMWVKFSDVVDIKPLYYCENTVAGAYIKIYWDDVSGDIIWTIDDNAGSSVTKNEAFAPIVDTWYNLIFKKYTVGVMPILSIYVDGVEVGIPSAGVDGYNDSNNIVWMGRDDTFNLYNGFFQEIRISKRNVGAAEITDYQTCTYTSDANLSLFLRCDEGIGTILNDESGNGIVCEAIGLGTTTWDVGLYNYLEVDSDRVVSVPVTTIVDNANNWFFMQNNVQSYADSITLDIGGINVLDYEPTTMLTAVVNPASPYTTGTATFTTGTNTVTGAGGATWTRDMIGGQIKCDGDAVYYKIIDVPAATTITLNTEYLEAGGAGEAYTIDTFNLTATLDDNSASANDGTITFGANPLGVVTTIGALTSSTVITTTPTIAPDLANLESNQGDLISTPYPNPTLSNNLLTPWFTPWSQLSNIPLVAFFLILGTVILIVLVVWIMKKTNNQLIASFVLIAGESMLWKLGIYELWPVIVTAIICFAIIVWERKPSI